MPSFCFIGRYTFRFRTVPQTPVLLSGAAHSLCSADRSRSPDTDIRPFSVTLKVRLIILFRITEFHHAADHTICFLFPAHIDQHLSSRLSFLMDQAASIPSHHCFARRFNPPPPLDGVSVRYCWLSCTRSSATIAMLFFSRISRISSGSQEIPVRTTFLPVNSWTGSFFNSSLISFMIWCARPFHRTRHSS